MVIPSPTTMLAILLASLGIAFILWRMFVPQLKFIWHCFFRPLGGDNQKARLDKVTLLSLPSHPYLIPKTVLQGTSRGL